MGWNIGEAIHWVSLNSKNTGLCLVLQKEMLGSRQKQQSSHEMAMLKRKFSCARSIHPSESPYMLNKTSSSQNNLTLQQSVERSEVPRRCPLATPPSRESIPWRKQHIELKSLMT
jgi:hypothetical protein